jgi:uncharacterized protein (TIGR00369 family)
MKITQKNIEQMNNNPLYRALGIRVVEAGEVRAVSILEPVAEVCWPFPGQPNGGILFTMMDTTTAWTILLQINAGYNCETIHLDIQYTAPARGKSFTCSAWITHRTNRLCFVRAEIHNPEDQLLAMGQGTFRILATDSIA